MLALSFKAGKRLQKPGLVEALGGEDGADFRLTLGEGSGLVHDQRVYLFHGLQGFRIADQDSFSGAAAGAHHDGHGCCQAKSTRAGNDEHGNCVHQSMRVARLRASHGPDKKGDHGCSQDRGDEVRGHPVSKTLNGGAAPLCFAHHFYDLGQQSGLAHTLGSHDQTTRSVDGSTHYLVSCRFFYRDGLAGDHRFIHRAAALSHHAVDGHFFAGTNAQQVAHGNLDERHIGFVSVGGDTARRFGSQAK